MGISDWFGGGEAKKEETPAAAAPAKAAPKLGKFSGKKICCSCPGTKAARDECVVSNGERECADLIEAHKVCLRAEGFTVK